MAIICNRIKEIREDRGLSTRQLSEALNVSIRTVQLWESGKNIPNAESIIQLAKYFEVSADYLLGLTDTIFKI